MIPWAQAWQAALYGPHGFYRRPEGPAGHFTTSTHDPLGTVFAEAIVTLARRDAATRIIDIGCGRGELVTQIHRLALDLTLTGIDVVGRPDELPADIGWIRAEGGNRLPDDLHSLTDVLVVAHEWLDVIPCPVLEIDHEGQPHIVLVDPDTGVEALAPDPPSPADLAWCAAHWPLDGLSHGDRIEVGHPRDLAWQELLARIDSGTLLAVDYGHTAHRRPAEGTLTAYARGGPTSPVPDGSCDITAHVAMDSLPGATLRTQRESLIELGLAIDPVSHSLATLDPPAYVAHLARQGVVRQLLDPLGLGGFLWATARHTAD